MKNLLLFLFVTTMTACNDAPLPASESPEPVPSPDETTIRELNKNYLEYWLKNDEEGVLGLFTKDARISPSSLCPMDSIGNMRQFWFPDDGSVTTIHQFTAEEISIHVMDTLASTTQKTFLEWSYNNGEMEMGKIQEGIELTIFRRASNGDWKIWRKMWTDVSVKDR